MKQIIVALMLLVLTSQACAARRALVVGVDSYEHVHALTNAVADAKALADELRLAGFSVSLHTNPTERLLKQAVRDFKAAIREGDDALFFFAGHGVQIGGANYLLPKDIRDQSMEQVKDDSLSLQRVLEDLDDQKARFSIAIIDACRDNPFPGRTRTAFQRGLAPTQPATGQMVMFAAGNGQKAVDKLGHFDQDKNGLFTRVLLKKLRLPDLPADRMLKLVREEVIALARAAGYDQIPSIYDQSVGDFIFVSASGTPPPHKEESAPRVVQQEVKAAHSLVAAATRVQKLGDFEIKGPEGHLAHVLLAFNDLGTELTTISVPSEVGKKASLQKNQVREGFRTMLSSELVHRNMFSSSAGKLQIANNGAMALVTDGSWARVGVVDLTAGIAREKRVIDPNIGGNGQAGGLSADGLLFMSTAGCPKNANETTPYMLSIRRLADGRCTPLKIDLPKEVTWSVFDEVLPDAKLATAILKTRGAGFLYIAKFKPTGEGTGFLVPRERAPEGVWGKHFEQFAIAPDGTQFAGWPNCPKDQSIDIPVFSTADGSTVQTLKDAKGCVAKAGFVSSRYLVLASRQRIGGEERYLMVYDVQTGVKIFSGMLSAGSQIRGFGAHDSSQAFAIAVAQSNSPQSGANVQVFQISK